MSKRYPYCFLLLCLCLLSYHLPAQQFMGYRSYEASIVSMVNQPAMLATSQKKLTVNAVASSFGLWNDAYDIKKSYLLSDASEIGVEGVDFFKDPTPGTKNGYLNIDFIGPSAGYAFKGGHHVALFTRFREIASMRGLDNKVFQVFNKIDSGFFNTPLTQENLQLDIHSFSEIGVNYSRQLYSVEDRHHFYGGVSLKYLMGAAAGSLHVADLHVNIADLETIRELNGTITVAYSDNVPTLGDAATAGLTNIGKKTGKSSVGADLGLVYELKDEREKVYYPYVLRVAVAVTDIGSIRYEPSEKSKSYTFNADNTHLDNINRKGGETLGQYITRMERAGYVSEAAAIDEYRVKLPTALRVSTDWNVLSRVFLSTNVLLSLLSAEKSYRPGYVSTVALTMRYEHKWYSAGMPLSYNALGDVNLGIVLRGGPLFIGSSSVFSSLFSQTVSTADAYAGLAWSF